MKKTVFRLLSVLLCLALAGCTSGGGGQAAPSAASGEAAPSAISSAAPAPAPSAATGDGLGFDAEITGLMGITNAELKELNGKGGLSYLKYGGAAVADYAGLSVAYPLCFWLSGDPPEMIEIFAKASGNAGRELQGNIWPDGDTVEVIELNEGSAGLLFGRGAGQAVTCPELNALFGQEPELAYTAAYAGEQYYYPVNTWSCIYNSDQYTMMAVFYRPRDAYVLYNAILMRA